MDNKCKYCSEVENDVYGDVASKDIFFEHLKLKVNDTAEINFADITVWITDEADLELYIDEADGYNQQFVKEKIPINFCPFCGRRLRNG